jgi:hypothetical protein
VKKRAAAGNDYKRAAGPFISITFGMRHCALDGPRRHRLEARRLALRERPDAGMAEDEKPQLRAAGIGERA